MRDEPLNTASAQPSGAGVYLYETIRALLAGRIGSGEIAAGTVLKEASIAAQLNVSRAPVRRALELLAGEGLIRAAPGQGYITGTAAPLRIGRLRLHEILTPRPEEEHRASGAIDRSPTWERIYAQVADEITACMAFGSWRIQEAALGDHFHVSRTVAREVLWRLTDRRLIEKDQKSHWIAGQLTARDLRDTLELRRLLEPAALARLAPSLDPAGVAQLLHRCETALADFACCDPAEMTAIETRLFHSLSAGLRNSRMLASIRRNQISLVVSRLFRSHFPMVDDESSLRDYQRILQSLQAGAGEAAARHLQQHLERVERLLLARLRVLSTLPMPAKAPWLTPVD